MTGRLISTAQLAERLGVTESYVRRMVHERRIPFVKLGDARNNSVRFDETDVDQWVAAHRTEAVR